MVPWMESLGTLLIYSTMSLVRFEYETEKEILRVRGDGKAPRPQRDDG